MKSAVSKTSERNNSDRIKPWLCSYLLLTGAIGFLVMWMFFEGSDLSLALRLIFLAVFVLTLKRWTGAILFAFCQLQLFFLEPKTRSWEISLNGWLWGALSISLLVVLSRYRTLQDREKKPAHRILHEFLTQTNGTAISPASQMELKRMLWQLTKLSCVLLTCAVASWTILGMFPTELKQIGLNTVRDFGLRPSGYRLLVVTITLFAGVFVVWVCVNEVVWQRLSPRQAKIYLNSVVLKFLRPDFRMVTRKTRKRNRKQIKSRLQTDEASSEIEV